MKNVIKKAMSIALTLALCATTFVSASIYFEKRATMRVFSGRIETGANVGSDEGELLLAIGTRSMGVEVGTDGSVASSDAVFPVFTGGAYHSIDEHTWNDINGKRSLNAPVFTLKAEGGPITAVNMLVRLSGDLSAATATHFGAYAVHYIEGREAMTRTFAAPLDVNVGGDSDVFEIGDLLQGESVEIYLSAWISAEELTNTDYQGGEMAAEAIFSYGEQQ